jgi:hypothetical protein
MTHTTKKLIAALGISALTFTACSAEDMEAYNAEQEAEDNQDAADAELVEVPDLTGVNLADAKDQLKALELDADEYDTSEDDKSVWRDKNWEVTEQDPASGEQVEPGTEILLGVQAIEDEEEAEEADEEETEDEATVEPENPEHAVALATGDDQAEAYLEPGESGDILFVQFDIGENFTQGLMISGAQRATFDALQTLNESDIEYSRVFFQGNLPMQDEYGNVEDTMALNAGYDRETVDQINYDNRTIQDTIWDLMDAGMVHPELQE